MDFDSENDDTSKNVCGEQNMDDCKKNRNVAKDEDNTKWILSQRYIVLFYDNWIDSN